MSNEHQPPPPPTQFGVFYPLGHVVVALESLEDAERTARVTRSFTPVRTEADRVAGTGV